MRGMSTARVGALGSVYAAGMTLFSLLLGRVRNHKRPWGLLLGYGLVWLSAGLLLWVPGLAGAALAFLLRGANQACRPLAKAQTSNLLGETHRGLALGATDTVAAAAQVLSTAAAGWLYTGHPTWPFLTALALIPIAALWTAALPGNEQV